tara:strand:+ start:1373 stop:1813 length:441 start_codon:yes stop_codon:yes gene_type:complete
MTLSAAGKLSDALTAAGIEAAIAVTPEDAIQFTTDPGEKRLRYSYTIDTPEGAVTRPLGGVFNLTFGRMGKLYKLDAPDSSGNWIGFKEDAPVVVAPPALPVQSPAPTGYHWVQGLMGLSLAKDSTLGLTDAQKTEVLNRIAKALE